MTRQPLEQADTWRLAPSAKGGGELHLCAPTGDRLHTSSDGSIKIGAAETAQPLSVQAPLGKYPEGARLLQGDDRSYVIAPLGNLIEEKYTPYLQFDDSPPALQKYTTPAALPQVS